MKYGKISHIIFFRIQIIVLYNIHDDRSNCEAYVLTVLDLDSPFLTNYFPNEIKVENEIMKVIRNEKNENNFVLMF